MWWIKLGKGRHDCREERTQARQRDSQHKEHSETSHLLIYTLQKICCGTGSSLAVQNIEPKCRFFKRSQTLHWPVSQERISDTDTDTETRTYYF
jgi:hypothetical protein